MTELAIYHVLRFGGYSCGRILANKGRRLPSKTQLINRKLLGSVRYYRVHFMKFAAVKAQTTPRSVTVKWRAEDDRANRDNSTGKPTPIGTPPPRHKTQKIGRYLHRQMSPGISLLGIRGWHCRRIQLWELCTVGRASVIYWQNLIYHLSASPS